MAIKFVSQAKPQKTVVKPTTVSSVTSRRVINKQLANTDTRLSAYGKLGQGVPENVQKITTQEPKLSFLERLTQGLGAFETGNATYQSRYSGKDNGVGTFLKTYGQDVASGLTAAFTGNREAVNYNKKFYKDIAEREGVTNAIAKFGIGFLGDILLDPSTWLGEGIAKVGTKVVSKGLGLGVKVADKLLPALEVGAKTEAVKGAIGKAFVFGYGASDGVVESVSSAIGRGERATKALVESNIRRLGTNTLSKDQAEQVAENLIKLKRAQYAGKETAPILNSIQDTAVKRAVTEQGARSMKLVQQHTPLEEGDLFQYYFPTGDKTKVKKFLDNTRSIRIGSENYMKKTAEVVALENIQKDLPTAFGKVEGEMARNAIYRKELQDIVTRVGKPLDAFANADEALKNGYKLLKEKGGMFGKDVGYVLENDYRVIQSLMSPGADFAAIDALAKATGFDAITGLFKRSVTGLFAPFYVRNGVSGMIQSYEAIGPLALHPTAVGTSVNIAAHIVTGKALKSEIELAGKTWKLKDIANAIVDRFGMTQGFATEGVDNTIKAVPRFFSRESTINSAKGAFLGQDSQVFRAARRVNNYIEIQNKAQIVVGTLMQGRSMQDALKMAEIGAFDYRHLTGFESKVLRRIIPFYAFTRKNVELQARTLAKSPARINNILKFIRDLGSNMSPEDIKNLPDYMRKAFTVKLGTDENGNPIVTSSLGTPIEQVSQLISGNPVLNGISQMNPLFKAPLELGFGKDSFRQQDLKDVYDAKEYSLAPKIIKDLLLITEVPKDVYKNGKKTNEQTIKYVADPTRLLIARSLFTSRGFSYLDQVFDGDLQGLVKYLRLTTGVKPQVIEPDTSAYFSQKAKEEEAKNILLRRGKIKSFESVYVPKPTPNAKPATPK